MSAPKETTPIRHAADSFHSLVETRQVWVDFRDSFNYDSVVVGFSKKGLL